MELANKQDVVGYLDCKPSRLRIYITSIYVKNALRSRRKLKVYIIDSFQRSGKVPRYTRHIYQDKNRLYFCSYLFTDRCRITWSGARFLFPPTRRLPMQKCIREAAGQNESCDDDDDAEWVSLVKGQGDTDDSGY